MRNVKHTQLLANHRSGRLLPSLQSSTPIQTEPSDGGGGGVKTGQKIAYYFKMMMFLYKKILITLEVDHREQYKIINIGSS